MTPLLRLALLPLLVFAFAGCSFLADIDTSAVEARACPSGADECPEGWGCVDGYCDAPPADAVDGGTDGGAECPDGTCCRGSSNPCPAEGRHHDGAACDGETCRLVCDALRADCDADGDNSCETDLADDDANCGACGTVCRGGKFCCNGSCLRASQCG